MSTGIVMSKREKRRRQNEEKYDSGDNEDIVIRQRDVHHEEAKEDQKHSGMLVRRNTFTVPKPRQVFDEVATDGSVNNEDDKNEDGVIENAVAVAKSDSDDSKRVHSLHIETWSGESNNATYNVLEKEESRHDTYNIPEPQKDEELNRPIPAPRKRQTITTKDPDKNSSDTDKDVMEIDADDGNESNSTESEKKVEIVTKISTCESDVSVVEPPKPKPRKLSSIAQSSFRVTDSFSKSKSMEEITVKVLSPRSVKSNPETKTEGYGSVTENVRESKKSDGNEQGREKKSRRFAALLQRRKQKKASKMLSSVMKLDRAKIPTISAILKDMKDDSSKAKLEEDAEEEEEKFDLQIESPRLPQSAPNDKMYVQYKNGFYVKNRDDVFREGEEYLSGGTGNRRMEDSFPSTMVRTAMMFQKYWSRSMLYFHGLLAGFGFAHAFTITAVLYYFKHNTQGFIDIYAPLALKIHFIFYMTIALSIISCLDRLDIGNVSRRHWEQICSKYPNLWMILSIYVASFILTFVNHSTESRFDSHQYLNATGDNLWDPKVHDDVNDVFSRWNHIVWVRDVMVLIAWLMMSETECPDSLYTYVKSLATKIESNGDARISAVIS